ncbi:MAG: extracellular solute-binding protein [Planctomycetales bacterium]
MRLSAVFPAFSRWLSPLVLALFLPGCNSQSAPQTSTAATLPFAGKHATLAVPAGTGLNELWLAPVQEWGTQTGGEAQIVEYDRASVADLTRAVSTGDAPAAAIVSTELLGDALLTLSISQIPDAALSAESGVGWNDQLQGVRDRIGAPRRKPILLPLSAPLLVCYFRSDLLKKANGKAPRTWDDYTALVEQLPQWAPGLTAVEPWSESFRATMFLARAVSHARHPDNYSVFVDLDSLAPLIDNPAYLRALEQSQAAVSRMPKDVWTLNPLDCRRLVLEGQAALAIGFEPAGGGNRADSPDWTANRAPEVEIGVCALPGVLETFNSARQKWDPLASRGGVARSSRSTLTAFDGFVAVSFGKPGGESGDAGWNAFASVAGPDFFSRFPAGMTGLTRESQLSNPTRYIGPELNGSEANDYLAVAAEALREPSLVFELPFPQRAAFRKALAGPLTEAMQGTTGREEAMRRVSADWTALIEVIGRDDFRRAYRQILGLGAKPDSGK